MQPFSPQSVSLGFIAATFLAKKGIKKKNLSTSGAIAGWIVGFLSVSCGLRGFLLFMFYQIGSKATKYRKDFKVLMDGDAGKGSVRGPSQVLACSAIAVVCSLFHAISFGEEKAIDFNESRFESMLACSIIAHYATCLADTLASELGILSKSEPYLLTNPRRKVPPGTNGGVTTDGFFYSFVGGVLIGLGALFMDICSGIKIQPVQMMLFSGGCGLVGSILDSLLGATVQATYYDQEKKLIYCCKEDAPKAVEHISGSNVLTNAQVNLFSVLLTCVFGGLFFGPMIF